MGAPHQPLPNPAAKVLVSQQHSSCSSPTSCVDSPTEPSLPLPSPPLLPSQFLSNSSDQSYVSSFSSSLSFTTEALNGTPIEHLKQKSNYAHKRRTRPDKLAHEHSKKATDASHASTQALQRHQSGTGCQSDMCCKCAAGLTADCAAVCCCPLAFLHLFVLTFIKLPSTVAWRTMVSMKKRIWTKDLPVHEHEEDERPPNIATPPWSCGASPAHPVTIARFDSQSLWRHFGAENVGFGGLSRRREFDSLQVQSQKPAPIHIYEK